MPASSTSWSVGCRRVGHGDPALKYLSRYLYRGVIAERDILADHNGKITFRYVESSTEETRTRTLAGANFLWLILQHVLPRGFRRVRDYGFLHGNAKKLLRLVQLILQVKLALPTRSKRCRVMCPECGHPMHVASISRYPEAGDIYILGGSAVIGDIIVDSPERVNLFPTDRRIFLCNNLG